MVKRRMKKLQNLTNELPKLFRKNIGKIGPHKGRIAELMLSGQKPVCELIHGTQRDKDDLNILNKAVLSKTLKTMMGHIYTENGKQYPSQLFCQPGSVKDMERLAKLFASACQGTTPRDKAFHREAGQILGYSKNDIDHFISLNTQSLID